MNLFEAIINAQSGMETDFATLAMMKHLFPTIKPGKVHFAKQGKNRYFVVTAVIDNLKILVVVILGPRGGMKKKEVVVDSSEMEIEIDQLLINNWDLHSGIVNLLEIGEDRRTLEPDEIFVALNGFANEVKKNPEAIVRRIKLTDRAVYSKVSSASAGIPTLGKRR